MTATTIRALVAAGATALAIGALSIPSLLQGFITAISSFLLLVLVLCVWIWLFHVANWSAQKQRFFTWLVALGTGVFIILFPWGFALLFQ